jgi:hypothetical protein
MNRVTGALMNHYSCTIGDHYDNFVTVEENMRRYTAREVQQAKVARELIGRLGHPSSSTAVEMLKKGIMNCEITQ